MVMLTSYGHRILVGRRVFKIMYLAVYMSNVLVNILILKIFIAKYCHL